MCVRACDEVDDIDTHESDDDDDLDNDHDDEDDDVKHDDDMHNDGDNQIGYTDNAGNVCGCLVAENNDDDVDNDDGGRDAQ